MSDNFIRVPPNSTGERVRTNTRIVSAATVNEHYMIVQDVTNDNQWNITGERAGLIVTGLIPAVYDYVNVGYTGTDPTTIQYYVGGAGGTLVGTLTLTYDGNHNLLTVTRT